MTGAGFGLALENQPKIRPRLHFREPKLAGQGEHSLLGGGNFGLGGRDRFDLGEVTQSPGFVERDSEGALGVLESKRGASFADHRDRFKPEPIEQPGHSVRFLRPGGEPDLDLLTRFGGPTPLGPLERELVAGGSRADPQDLIGLLEIARGVRKIGVHLGRHRHGFRPPLSHALGKRSRVRHPKLDLDLDAHGRQPTSRSQSPSRKRNEATQTGTPPPQSACHRIPVTVRFGAP
jgi:hypothetical protein